MASATDALPALSLRFSAGGGLRLAAAPPSPAPPPGEARVRVRRAGVCSTDLQILQGYVPGFDAALGHEFVGDVVAYTPAGAGSVGPAAAAAADAAGAALAGARVAGEINCRGAGVPPCAHADPFFRRNHAPGRTVLGIIGRDGCLAEYVDLPAENLHR
jgi:threonine dehydrogenase-like Zn-dependent dehydrogenase